MMRAISSMGALLKSYNPKSRKLEDAVIMLQLDATLLSDTIEKQNYDKFKLLVFASRDISDDSAYNCTTELFLDRSINFNFLLRTVPTVPDKINLWLFCMFKDENGLLCEELFAWASCTPAQLINSNNAVNMVDVAGTIQARLQICIADDLTEQQRQQLQISNDQQNGVTNQLCELLIEQVSKTYDRFRHTSDSVFIWLDSQIQRLPLIAFVVLSSQIRVDPPKAEAFFLHLLNLSCDRLRKNANSLKLEDCTELLAEMALWSVRSKIYIYDTVRGQEKRRMSSDLWSRMGVFPDASYASGDCEDFSEMVLEFLHILKYIPLSKNCASLQQIQRCLLQYTPCMCVGQLASGSKYCPHAYVVIVDTIWFTKRLSKQTYCSKLPCIVIETTAYTQSTWSASTIQGNPQMDEVYHLQCRLAATLTFMNAEDRYDRSIKWKMPVSVVNKENKYGKVYALLTSDYYNAQLDEFEAMHLLLSTQTIAENPRLGVDHLQLATYSNDIQFTVANRLNKETTMQLNQEMKNLPFSHFPKAPVDTKIVAVPMRNKRCMLFDIRYVDWQEHESTLTTMFREFLKLLDQTKTWNIYRQSVAVSDDCKLVQISVVEA
jgi:hypothetical protein